MTTKRESRRKLPCKCGNMRPMTWTTTGLDGGMSYRVECRRCLTKTILFRFEIQAIRAWNEQQSGVI